MKRLVVLIISISIVFGLCACSSSDYKRAVTLYEDGSYEEAEELFLKLEDYEDSEVYAEKCRIEERYALKEVMDLDELEASCEHLDSTSYKELLRNPEKYIGAYFYFEGEVHGTPMDHYTEAVTLVKTAGWYARGTYIDYDYAKIYYKEDVNIGRLIKGDRFSAIGVFEGVDLDTTILTRSEHPVFTVYYYEIL